jgi:hypothetical protein
MSVDFTRAQTLALAMLEEDLPAVDALIGDGDRELCATLAGALVAFAISTLGKEDAARLFSSMIFDEMTNPQAQVETS